MTSSFYPSYPFKPRLTFDTEPFWKGCSKGQLLFQKCCNCGHVRWPASFICPQCHHMEHQWIESSGLGTLYSYVVFYRAFVPAVEDRVPYVVGSVRLQEGPVLLSNIVGCDIDDIRCDMNVRVVFEDIGDGFVLPFFEPV